MRLLIIILGIWVLAGCSTIRSSQANDLVPLAKQFMTSYARDLSQGDRAAVAERYHPQGTYFLGDGHKSLESYEATLAYYRDHWKAPSTFEWQDLSFEPIGNTGVLVLGKFKWGELGVAEPRTYSYSGLLVLVNGRLKIRAEDESSAGK